MTVTARFEHRQHPRDWANGRFVEKYRPDPGRDVLGEWAGSIPTPPFEADEGEWIVADDRYDEDRHSPEGWPHIRARQVAAARLLPSAAENWAGLHTFASATEGPQPVTLLCRTSDGQTVVVEKDVLPGEDDDDPQPILERDPGDGTWRWLDERTQIVAFFAGHDASGVGRWWLGHVAGNVPDLDPVTFSDLPDAEWTGRDAPVAAVFVLDGEDFSDERPAGSVFFAQAADRDGVYGVLVAPGQAPREEYLRGHSFGGRVRGYQPGALQAADVAAVGSVRDALERVTRR